MHKVDMKYFDNLQQLVNYIPNCLICGKSLPILIQGRWFSFDKVVCYKSLKTIIRDNMLESKHRSFNFKIDITTNKIIQGEEHFKEIFKSLMFVMKKCPTCYMCISLSPYQLSNYDFRSKVTTFPVLNIDAEELQYTTKGGKHLILRKDYHTIYSATKLYPGYQVRPQGAISLSLDNKKQYIPNEYLILEKIKNFSSLKNKISTILIFQ